MTERIDELWAKVLADNPLLQFSIYVAMQGQYVQNLGEEILATLDHELGTPSRGINGNGINDIHAKYWFWVLGAYEVVRMLHQYRSCFSSRMQADLAALKKMLAPVRIRFAKHEIPYEELASRGPNRVDGQHYFSIVGFDHAARDLKFEIGGKPVSVRQLVVAFREFRGSITVEDINSRLSSFQAKQAGE